MHFSLEFGKFYIPLKWGQFVANSESVGQQEMGIFVLLSVNRSKKEGTDLPLLISPSPQRHVNPIKPVGKDTWNC